jgi:tryptophan synthase alpha chain
MSRIAECFAGLRGRGERALIPFVTAGDPDLGTTEALVLAMAEAGADLVELGVPFSDPIADGPTIQRATERALARGTSLRRVLELVKRLRSRTPLPLVLMGSANPFYAMGARRFVEAAAEAGADGVIVPDLPPEEGADLYGAAAEAGLDGVLLAAPTTTPARLRMLAERSRGFLYFVSLTGVTGARAELAADLESRVRSARALCPLPVCVGFGVSTPEHAAAIGRYADGVVVGSAIVERIERAATPDEAVDSVARFVAALKAPLRRDGREGDGVN